MVRKMLAVPALLIQDQVKGARLYLASALRGSPLFPVYLIHLLETVISKGDVHQSDNTHQADVELASREIAELLDPLATLVEGQGHTSDMDEDPDIIRLCREAWFNMVVHSITPTSKIGQQYTNVLRVLAMETRPLIDEDRANQFESEIELNTVLRRGMNAPHTAEQKSRLIAILPRCESDIRALSYPRVIFLHAAHLVETLRAHGGDCTHILTYFLDPSLNGSAMENCMAAIADEVFKIFLSRALSGHRGDSSAPIIATQLAHMLTGCCHRIARVQQIASSCADRIISSMPSSLCQRSSLFALLELLSIMWMSCLDSETDEYDWKSRYVSERGEIEVVLSDNFELRKSTLNALYKRARIWVMSVINIAPLDVKGLLQVCPLHNLHVGEAEYCRRTWRNMPTTVHTVTYRWVEALRWRWAQSYRLPIRSLVHHKGIRLAKSRMLTELRCYRAAWRLQP